MKRCLTLLLILILAVYPAVAEQNAEIENYTRYTDYTPYEAEPVGLIPGENHRVLVAWFSRVGNTVFDPNVDVVTSATMQWDEK